MTENKSLLKFIKEAFEFEFKEHDWGNRENDRFPMSTFEKHVYVLLTLLSKDGLKEVVNQYSSYNYGVHLLNSVFPKNENPGEFHSRDSVVCLDEHPVQVMGWKEHDKIIEEGVAIGLDEMYINIGFEAQAEKRGIDLEYSFNFEVPNHNPTEAKGIQAFIGS